MNATISVRRSRLAKAEANRPRLTVRGGEVVSLMTKIVPWLALTECRPVDFRVFYLVAIVVLDPDGPRSVGGSQG